MIQFIKTCISMYGNSSSIYRYININQIIEIHIEHTQSESNVEALLTSGERVLILKTKDLIKIIGTDYAKEIMKEIKDYKREQHFRFDDEF